MSPENANRNSESTQVYNGDSIFVNGKVLLNDTTSLYRSFPERVCYVSQVPEEFGYPNYHITCQIDESSVAFLEDDDNLWVYRIYLDVSGQFVVANSNRFEVGVKINDILRTNSKYDTSALSSNETAWLNEKRYSKIEQLRYPFTIPSYLSANDEKGEIVIYLGSEIVSKVQVNFYTEDYFD